MDLSVTNALWLLQRQCALETVLRSNGGIRLAEGQELPAIHSRPRRYSEAAKATLTAASQLHRPVYALSESGVLRSDQTCQSGTTRNSQVIGVE